MFNWVFRHEPSPEPTRMQAFRVREYVRVRARRIGWSSGATRGSSAGIGLLESLGLPAKADVATDPFFGKGGKMLAAEPEASASSSSRCSSR